MRNFFPGERKIFLISKERRVFMDNSSNFIITGATHDDIPDIAAIDLETSQNQWNRMLFEDEFHAATFIGFVAKISDTMRTVGFVLGRLIDKEFEILKIGVVKPFQRQGIGTLLFERTLDCAKKRKAQQAFLEVGSRNHPAQKLYEKAGFRKMYIRKGYYRNAEDAIIMALSLLSQ